MKPCLYLTLIAVLVLAATAESQTTWYVDDDNTSGPWFGSQQFPFQYIQDGIDAAIPGDTVLVADGTYRGNGNRDLDFLGKTITVQSQNGPALTVVDCEGNASDPHRGFVFQSGEEPLAVLSGFTIMNGYITSPGYMALPPFGSGGGIQCVQDSSPTIENCVIRNCTAEICGGGMIAYFCEPRIVGCVFLDNIAMEENIQGGAGGGLSVYFHGDTEVNDCTFLRNSAENFGGAVAVNMMSKSVISGCLIQNNNAATGGGICSGGFVVNEKCSPVIENCEIKWNVDAVSGGGIACICPEFQGSGGSPVIRNNIVFGNSANGGGGIYLDGGGFLLESNEITGNAARSGGGIKANVNSNGAGDIKNCSIRNNSAGTGGGLYLNTLGKNNVIVTQCTVAFNTAGTSAGGVYTGGDNELLACTLWGNTAGNRAGGVEIESFSAPVLANCILWNNTPDEIYRNVAAAPTVAYCNVAGGWPGWRDIDADPLLVDPDNGDFHLTWSSPCINMGSNEAAPAEDIDGDPRPYMGTCDIGADEFVGDHALGADAFSFSAVSGGVIHFSLFGGAPNGGRAYLMLASVSGTAPGTPLPGGPTLPLNVDSFTWQAYGWVNTILFQNFRGNLSWGSSTASALLDTLGPKPWAAGTTLYFAYTLEGAWDFASNPVAVEILP